MTMASPTATSATVMAMVKSVKTSARQVAAEAAKATRLMLTALSISSMPSRMPTALRRVSTPKRPMANTSAASVEIGAERHRSVVAAREVERAEQGHHQQDAEQLEA